MNWIRKSRLPPRDAILALNEFTLIWRLRWLAVAGVFLHLVPGAMASLEITGGEGDLEASEFICINSSCSNRACVGSDEASFAAPVGNPQDPSADSGQVPQCTANVDGHPVSVGPVNIQGGYAGNAQSMTLTASASGSASGINQAPRVSFEASGGATIAFRITGAATAVAISVSMTAMNCESASATLTGPNVNAEITADNNGQHGSFPDGPFEPGDYQISLSFGAGSPPSPPLPSSVSYNFSATITISQGETNTIQWNNPAGGSFATSENWEPQMVPGAGDTAVFGLQSLYSVNVGTATTDRLEVRNGGVTFTNANYNLTAGGPSPPSLLIDNGLLTLASGSVFGVEGLIGETGAAGLDVQSGAALSLFNLRVGGAGNGDLTVASNGLVVTAAACLIGNGAGSGTVDLAGPNAGMDSGTLVVGSLGEGLLSVNSGAFATSTDGRVGSFPDKSGSVFISGAGSRWTLTDALTLQQGILSVQDGGMVDAQLSIDVGLNPSQSAHLQMLLGGLVQTPNCTVWGGLLDVDGQSAANSRLDVGDLLSLGGLLSSASTPTSGVEAQISGGGRVVAQRVALGDRNAVSSATLTISGVGGNGQPSLLNVAGANPSLTVSGAPQNTLLEIRDGGMLTMGTIMSRIGSGSLIGRVLVHGESGLQPATWSSSGAVSIGSEVVPSELAVQEGGVVTGDADIFVAFGSGELGRVTVSGGDSSITTGSMLVGAEGDGELMVSDGGHVTSVLGRVLGHETANDSPRGTGLATIRGTPFSSSEWHVTTTECRIGTLGPATLRLEGETIGPFSVGGATLRADVGVEVGAQGFVRGNGTLISPRVVGGNISPDVDIETPLRGKAVLAAAPSGNNRILGLSSAGGTIAIEGDYEQPADDVITIDVNGVGDGEFDILHVTGNVTLGGKLEIRFPGTYLPRTGDSFSFLKVDGAIIGEFAEVTFPQLAPGFLFDTTQVQGGLLLTALSNAVLAPTFLLDISTRLQIGTGHNVLIGGFILQGTEPKTVLIRAIGPSLAAAGLSGVMADPTLELHDSTGGLIAQNDNWRETHLGGVITEDQFFDIFATGIPPPGREESALLVTLDPGAYTAIVAGANSATGIGLVEIYDIGPAAVAAKLANISTRGLVQTGDDVIIGGFIVGNQPTRVIVRAIGPTLGDFGVPNPLANPVLELHDGAGALLASNDDWRDTQEAEIQATGIPPGDDHESAIVATLPPGAYTAIVRGQNNITGVGLVEVYQLP